MLKDFTLSLELEPTENRVVQTAAIFWSHDVNTAKIYIELLRKGTPIILNKDVTVRVMMLFDDENKSEHIYTAKIEDELKGLVSITLEESMRMYVGQVTCGVYVDYQNEEKTDNGYFTFGMRRSLIDKDMPEMQKLYVSDFEEALKTFEEFDSRLDDMEKHFDDRYDTAKMDVEQIEKLIKNNSVVTENNFEEFKKNIYKISDIGEIKILSKKYNNLTDHITEEFEGNYLNVAWFGAKTDGVTDDTESFIKAIEKAESLVSDRFSTGATIFVPAGQTLVSQPLKIQKSGIQIVGAGRGATTIIQKGTFTDVFVFHDEEKAMYFSGIKDLSIYTPNSDNGYHIKMINNIYNTISNINSISWKNGILIDGCGKMYMNKVTLSQENRTQNVAGYGIKFAANYGLNSDIHLNDVQVLIKEDRDSDNSVLLEACDGIYFNNFHIHGGFLIKPSEDNFHSTLASVMFSNAYFDGSKTNNITFSGKSEIYRNFFFSNVNFRQGYHGIAIDTSSNIDKLMFSNVHIYNQKLRALSFMGNNIKRFSLDNCIIDDNNLSGRSDIYDIEINSGMININNIHINNSIKAGGNIAFGANVEGNIANVVLSKSSIEKEIKGRTNKLNFSNFIGSNIKGKGSASIAKGEMKATIKHDIKVVRVSPEDVFITLRTPINPATNFWVSNVTENSFDVNVDKPLENPAAITWHINTF